eukprot:860163-Pelagomonas_calceolata.AAC.4
MDLMSGDACPQKMPSQILQDPLLTDDSDGEFHPVIRVPGFRRHCRRMTCTCACAPSGVEHEGTCLSQIRSDHQPSTTLHA